MNRGLNHNAIFIDGVADRALFLATLADTIAKWKIHVHAYSLMGNHYHLLLETPLPNISRAMRHLDGLYTQRFNRQHHRDGPLFRGRFKSRLVQKELYFLELIRYIHTNGVKANLYTHARLDPNCSHTAYLFPNKKPTWLTTDLGLSYFRDTEELNTFVMERVADGISTALNTEKWPAILGEKAFIKKINLTYLGKGKPHRSKPQERPILWVDRPDPKTILKKCADYYQTNVPTLLCNEKQLSPELRAARSAAMSLLREGCQLSFSAIGKLMGDLTDSAVEKSCRMRMKKQDERFNRLRDLVLPDAWKKWMVGT
jgi:REP element-mobilizing transposase RayT